MIAQRGFVRSLLAPLPTLLLGGVAGIGGTLLSLGWLCAWSASQQPEPVLVAPETWAWFGHVLQVGSLVFLLPVVMIGAIWLWDTITGLRRPVEEIP